MQLWLTFTTKTTNGGDKKKKLLTMREKKSYEWIVAGGPELAGDVAGDTTVKHQKTEKPKLLLRGKDKNREKERERIRQPRTDLQSSPTMVGMPLMMLQTDPKQGKQNISKSIKLEPKPLRLQAKNQECRLQIKKSSLIT